MGLERCIERMCLSLFLFLEIIMFIFNKLLISQNIILAVKFFTDFMNDIITFLVSVATFSSGVSH